MYLKLCFIILRTVKFNYSKNIHILTKQFRITLKNIKIVVKLLKYYYCKLFQDYAFFNIQYYSRSIASQKHAYSLINLMYVSYRQQKREYARILLFSLCLDKNMHTSRTSLSNVMYISCYQQKILYALDQKHNIFLTKY